MRVKQRKKAADRLSTSLQIKVTEGEKVLFTLAANASHLTLSAWIRVVLHAATTIAVHNPGGS